MDASVEGTFTSYRYDDLNGSGSVEFSIGIWVGLELKSDGDICVWAGSEEAGICVSSCGNGSEVQTSTLQAVAEKLMNELAEDYSDYLWTQVIILAAAVVVLGMIYLVSQVSFASVAYKLLAAAGLA